MEMKSIPRLELIQVAEAVSREKSIDKEEVIVAMEEAIQKAASMASIDTYGYTVYPERKTFLEKLLEETDPEAVIQLPHPELQKQWEQALILERLTAHSPIIAMMPYQIHFE